MNSYEIRDPIHKHISFNAFERGIIDHPFFQRLRFISQLGFIEAYVYPGACHDRFTHALGAMHVADRLFGKIVNSTDLLTQRLTKEELENLKQRIRLAGLLHDIGHGPFSHASEVIFPKLNTLPLDWSWWYEAPSDRQAVHEDYSVLLIQTLVQEGVLDQTMAQDICSLVHAGIKPSP